MLYADHAPCLSLVFACAEPSRASELYLVDLAGSERSKAAGTEGEGLKEGAAINTSLFNLRNVIKQLADNCERAEAGKVPKRVPFRESQLTMMLMTTLQTGKTIVIAALSPAAVNYEETLSTLRFAEGCKAVKAQVKVNHTTVEDELRAEIAALRARIEERDQMLESGGGNLSMGSLHGYRRDDALKAIAAQLEAAGVTATHAAELTDRLNDHWHNDLEVERVAYLDAKLLMTNALKACLKPDFLTPGRVFDARTVLTEALGDLIKAATFAVRLLTLKGDSEDKGDSGDWLPGIELSEALSAVSEVFSRNGGKFKSSDAMEKAMLLLQSELKDGFDLVRQLERAEVISKERLQDGLLWVRWMARKQKTPAERPMSIDAALDVPEKLQLAELANSDVTKLVVEYERNELMDELALADGELKEVAVSWEERVAQTKRAFEAQAALLEKTGLKGVSEEEMKRVPSLRNLSVDDPFMTNQLAYYIKSGARHIVGCDRLRLTRDESGGATPRSEAGDGLVDISANEGNPAVHIQLQGVASIQPRHCELTYEEGDGSGAGRLLTIMPCEGKVSVRRAVGVLGSQPRIEGVPFVPYPLQHGDVIVLGEHPAIHFSVVDPVEAADFLSKDLNGLQVDALRAKRRVAALQLQQRRLEAANPGGDAGTGSSEGSAADQLTTIKSTVEGWLTSQSEEAIDCEETAANAEADRVAAEERADHALEQVKLLERQKVELENRVQEARDARPPRLSDAKDMEDQIAALDQTISQHEAQHAQASEEARAIFSGIRPGFTQPEIRTASDLDDYSRNQAALQESYMKIQMLRDKEVRLASPGPKRLAHCCFWRLSLSTHLPHLPILANAR